MLKLNKMMIKQLFKKFIQTTVFQLLTITLFIVGCACGMRAICHPIMTENNQTSQVHNVDTTIKSSKLNREKLDYDIRKQRLISEVNKYILRIAPQSKLDGRVVVEACLEHDRDIVFVLAQGQIESHFGTAGIAKKTNSVFNVNSCDGLSAATIIQRGHGFSHPNHSVVPYLELLGSRYLVNGKTEKDLMRNFVNCHGRRYATSRQYEANLRKAYDSINRITRIKTQYDELRQLHQNKIALAN